MSISKLLVWSPIIVFIIYAFFPKFLIRFTRIAIFQKGELKQKIALTFDDGPDPLYTPILLDVLKKYNVKATFFILGSKAEKNSDLTLRIHEEGHLIGIHNYVHYANCFLTPGQVKKQFNQSADIVQQITGYRPYYYRPPWGLPNFSDLFEKEKFQIVMWSIMVGDWRRKVGREKLKNRLLHSLHDGAIIVLHDSGETFGADEDAPTNMISALEDVLHEVHEKGYECVRVDELVRMVPERGNPEFDSVGTKDCLSRYG
ncbi:MAG TPA: polysaccharide deacetylase family protein [Paenibacillaceae bacterium]|nr:polysaccharide deacetylase family protein [Paenibacillaceae bacterium]